MIKINKFGTFDVMLNQGNHLYYLKQNGRMVLKTFETIAQAKEYAEAQDKLYQDVHDHRVSQLLPG